VVAGKVSAGHAGNVLAVLGQYHSFLNMPGKRQFVESRLYFSFLKTAKRLPYIVTAILVSFATWASMKYFKPVNIDGNI